MITSCAYLAIMFFTLVMEDQVIFVVGGIIADLAKMCRLTVVVNCKELHTT